MSGQRPAAVRVDTVAWDPDRKEIRINAGTDTAITLRHETQDPLFDPLLLALNDAARHTDDEPEAPTQFAGGMTSDEAFTKLARLYGKYGEKRFFYRDWCEKNPGEKCRELLKEALGWEATLLSTTAELKRQVGTRTPFGTGPIQWLRNQASTMQSTLNPLQMIWNGTNALFEMFIGKTKWTSLLTLTTLMTFLSSIFRWLYYNIGQWSAILTTMWETAKTVCQIVMAIPSSVVLSMCGAILIGLCLDEMATQAQKLPKVVNTSDVAFMNIMTDHRECMFKLLNNQSCGEQPELDRRLGGLVIEVGNHAGLAKWFLTRLRHLARPRPPVQHVRLVK